MVNETKKRSIAKMASWRVISTVTTTALVFLFTGEIALAAGIGLVDMLLNLVLYYVHERAWNTIIWGRQK